MISDFNGKVDRDNAKLSDEGNLKLSYTPLDTIYSSYDKGWNLFAKEQKECNQIIILDFVRCDKYKMEKSVDIISLYDVFGGFNLLLSLEIPYKRISKSDCEITILF